jgi:hypothetical protein
VTRAPAYVFPLLIALYYPFCTAKVQPTMPPSEAPLAELWQHPDDLASRDLMYGPWGSESATGSGVMPLLWGWKSGALSRSRLPDRAQRLACPD